MGKPSNLHPNFLLLCLWLFIVALQQTNSQFMNEVNKPIRTQQNFEETNDFVTPETNPVTQNNPQAPNFQKNKPSLSQYRRISSSQEFHTLFAQNINKISLSEVVNATVISNGLEMCADSLPCQFFYYVIKPKFDPEEVMGFDFSGSGSIRNVFIVAGMHGNEFLGPTAMLNAIKYLQTPKTRVILFPLANPSGYDHNTRLTFPTNLDPNRDFPIQQYKKCYQTSSSLIIDHIYRKYHIDLTLALHNGRSEIGWAWGTMRERINSHTKDELIYRDIGQWLKFIGGKNKKLKMETFSIGTINEVVYPVEGGFQDWAYAASWYTASVSTTPTRSCNYLKFPYNMTNGLVFLFELGPFQVPEQQFGSEEGLTIFPNSTDLSNGYISRTIRMLKELVKIPNPRLNIKFSKGHVMLKLHGCKQGTIEKMNITKKSDGTKLFTLNKKTQIQGILNNKTVQPSVFTLQKSLNDSSSEKSVELQTLIVEYELACDPLWMGTGNTIFGKKRAFKVKESIILVAEATAHLPKTFYSSKREALDTFKFVGQVLEDSLPDKFEDFMEENSQFLIVMVVLVIVLSIMMFVVFVICRQISKDRKQRRMKKMMKRIEKAAVEGEGSSVMSEEDAIDASQQEIVDDSIGQRQITPKKGKKQTQKKVESYPHLCESDKSMKTDDLNEQIELGDFADKNTKGKG